MPAGGRKSRRCRGGGATAAPRSLCDADQRTAACARQDRLDQYVYGWLADVLSRRPHGSLNPVEWDGALVPAAAVPDPRHTPLCRRRPVMPNAMTLVIPLKAKDGVALQDFYDYWLNAHVTLPPRFPGISSVWLHKTSLADSLWPAIDGVSMQSRRGGHVRRRAGGDLPDDGRPAGVHQGLARADGGRDQLPLPGDRVRRARTEQRDRARRDRPGARRHRHLRPPPGVPAQAAGGVGRRLPVLGGRRARARASPRRTRC